MTKERREVEQWEGRECPGQRSRVRVVEDLSGVGCFGFAAIIAEGESPTVYITLCFRPMDVDPKTTGNCLHVRLRLDQAEVVLIRLFTMAQAARLELMTRLGQDGSEASDSGKTPYTVH